MKKPMSMLRLSIVKLAMQTKDQNTKALAVGSSMPRNFNLLWKMMALKWRRPQRK